MNSPTPELIKSTRKALGLTQTQAATLIFKKMRAWQYYETGEREMDPALWELFNIKSSASD